MAYRKQIIAAERNYISVGLEADNGQVEVCCHLGDVPSPHVPDCSCSLLVPDGVRLMDVSDPRYDARDKTYRTLTVFGAERVGRLTVIPAFFPNEGHDVGIKLMLCYLMALNVADRHGSESVVLPDTYGADGSSCGALWDAVNAFLRGKRATLKVIHICCLGRPRSFDYFRERLLDDTAH